MLDDDILDSSKYVRTLLAGGMPRDQAEACASALADVFWRQSMQQDKMAFRAEMKGVIRDISNYLTLRFGALFVLSVLIIGALVYFHI